MRRTRSPAGRETRIVRPSALPILVLVLVAAGCPKQRDMADEVEMPDSMPVVRAMHDPAAMDSMLDTIPGGEMARGDSAAAMKMLKKKM